HDACWPLARTLRLLGRTLLWPLMSRYGRCTGAISSLFQGVTTGTALDPTLSTPPDRFRSRRQHQAAPNTLRRVGRPAVASGATAGLAPRPRNSSVPPRRLIKAAGSRPQAVPVR